MFMKGLTEQLLEQGYEVHGIIRRASSFNTGRIDHLFENSEVYGERLFLHHGDMTDSSNLNRLMELVEPAEVYNLAAQEMGLDKSECVPTPLGHPVLSRQQRRPLADRVAFGLGLAALPRLCAHHAAAVLVCVDAAL